MPVVRSFTTGAAVVVGAAALTAVPALQAAIGPAGVPTPTALSGARVQLAALTDITPQGIADAFANGWGGNLGPADPFYPGAFANDTKATGISGAVYYVLDESGLVPFNLDDYFFEAGGVRAVAYVGISSVFGADSLPGQLAKAVFADGTLDIADAVVALTAGIPVVGAVTSVYFTGQVPGDPTVYGTGFAGVLAYANTVLPGISDLLDKIGIGSGSHGDDEDDDDDEDGEDGDEGHEHGHGHGAAAVAVSRGVPAPSAATSSVGSSPESPESPAAAVDLPADTPSPRTGAETAAAVTAPVGSAKVAKPSAQTRAGSATTRHASRASAGAAEKPAAAQSTARATRGSTADSE